MASSQGWSARSANDARFLALNQYVNSHWQEYEYILCVDMDVLIMKNPIDFMRKHSEYDIFVGSGLYIDIHSPH